jgi:AcrR family transcriptional regulator
VTVSGTSARILDASIEAFGTRGYGSTSLDDLARDLGVRKQTILYWFSSKEALLGACLDAVALELAGELSRPRRDGRGLAPDRSPAPAGRSGWRPAGRPSSGSCGRATGSARRRRPGSSSGSLRSVDRARTWLAAEMAAGRLRTHDPDAVVLGAYSMLTGLAAEVETQRRPRHANRPPCPRPPRTQRRTPAEGGLGPVTVRNRR